LVGGYFCLLENQKHHYKNIEKGEVFSKNSTAFACMGILKDLFESQMINKHSKCKECCIIRSCLLLKEACKSKIRYAAWGSLATALQLTQFE